MGFCPGEPFAFGDLPEVLADFELMGPLNLILLPAAGDLLATGDLLTTLAFLGDGVRCRSGLFALSLRLGGD